MSHTPGPWNACGSADCRCGSVFGDSGRVYVATALGPDDLAQVDPVPTRDFQRGNMRLIAAAPGMLKSLEEFVTFHSGHVLPPELQTTMAAARATIAKAKGETE